MNRDVLMDGWVGGRLPILLYAHSLIETGLSRNKILHSPQLNQCLYTNFMPSKSKPTCSKPQRSAKAHFHVLWRCTSFPVWHSESLESCTQSR